MFVVVLTYKQPLEVIDAHVEAHVAFLDTQYQHGNFLASGRRVPRVGGVILARAMPFADLEAILKTDPFFAHDLADYDIVEFAPNMALPAYAQLIEA